MFGKHKAIERFSIIFLSLAICFSVLMGTIVIRKNAADATRLSNQSIYTTKVTMSRSHVAGDVVDVMVSKDKTKSFVLLKMNSMSDLSADAEDYMMFLTGATENQGYADLKSQPSGGIYVFGVSGYIGVYLVNGEPFESQILNLVVRGTKDYSSKTDASGENNVAEIPKGGDASFAKFDQMQIYFNPGAVGAHHADFLDDASIDVEKMYEESVVVNQKESIRKALSKDLQTMFEAQRKAQRFERDLTDEQRGIYGAVLAPVDKPEVLSTDVIRAYSVADDTELTWSDSSNGWVDDSNTKYADGSYYLDLDTDYVFDGGYDFDWQKDVSGGYIKELKGDLTVDEYLKKQKDLLEQANADGQLRFDRSTVTLYNSDGSMFTVNKNSEDTKLKKMSEGVENMLREWSTYFDTRVTFQTVHLKQLIYAERDANIVSSTYSENFNEKVLVNY